MNIYSCVDSKNIDKLIVLFYSCFLNSTNKQSLRFYIITDDDSYNINIPLELKELITIKSIKFDDKWHQILNEFNQHFYKDSIWCKNASCVCHTGESTCQLKPHYTHRIIT